MDGWLLPTLGGSGDRRLDGWPTNGAVLRAILSIAPAASGPSQGTNGRWKTMMDYVAGAAELFSGRDNYAIMTTRREDDDVVWMTGDRISRAAAAAAAAGPSVVNHTAHNVIQLRAAVRYNAIEAHIIMLNAGLLNPATAARTSLCCLRSNVRPSMLCD